MPYDKGFNRVNKGYSVLLPYEAKVLSVAYYRRRKKKVEKRGGCVRVGEMKGWGIKRRETRRR